MLRNTINQFLDYCKNTDFPPKSIEAFTLRLKHFNDFVNLYSIQSIEKITYEHLLKFITEYGYCSEHVKKSRIWALHKFFHFMQLKGLIKKNIALKIPYPKIEKKVPQFLTINEFKKILDYFMLNADSLIGLRNLIMVMLLGFLGLRTSAIVKLNIKDIDLTSGFIWVNEKGFLENIKRKIFLPQLLCSILADYLKKLNQKQGPLFLSKRNKRISARMLQNLFRESADKLEIDKHLHPHLFRHTAGTHLNKVAGPEVTQRVLGHKRRINTRHYVHLNPDFYAGNMKDHPYMKL